MRLAQILSNLLNNAATYTEHAGRIVVRAWRDGENAAISVRDNGMGISAEALPRMFGMFSRGDRDIERAQGGLGIGLALSRRLAQMHGGTLEAASGGRVVVEGRDVTDLPPAQRGISMVFQNYALFPHLSVADNIGFGLSVRKVPKAEAARRLQETAELLGVEKLLARKPS